MELDRLRKTCAGKPIDEVKISVRKAFRRMDVKASESDITDYATHISNGTKIKVKMDRFH